MRGRRGRAGLCPFVGLSAQVMAKLKMQLEAIQVGVRAKGREESAAEVNQLLHRSIEAALLDEQTEP